jgi:hypothetical protein
MFNTRDGKKVGNVVERLAPGLTQLPPRRNLKTWISVSSRNGRVQFDNNLGVKLMS